MKRCRPIRDLLLPKPRLIFYSAPRAPTDPLRGLRITPEGFQIVCKINNIHRNLCKTIQKVSHKYILRSFILSLSLWRSYKVLAPPPPIHMQENPFSPTKTLICKLNFFIIISSKQITVPFSGLARWAFNKHRGVAEINHLDWQWSTVVNKFHFTRYTSLDWHLLNGENKLKW